VTSIAAAGASNGIVQTALRLTMPGTPDFYQGTEYWDFSLVDPDNRGTVDFDARCRSLQQCFDTARADWRRGVLKQQMIQRLLKLRADHASLFAGGNYRPVAVSGRRAANVVAFTRRDQEGCVLVVAARHIADPLLDRDALTPPAEWWADTTCVPEWSSRLRGCFSKKVHSGGEPPISQCLVDLPVEIFVSA
jgi:maltooligosyltrehalose synthase